MLKVQSLSLSSLSHTHKKREELGLKVLGLYKIFTQHLNFDQFINLVENVNPNGTWQVRFGCWWMKSYLSGWVKFFYFFLIFFNGG